ncbi:S8 family serine peptidase [Brassicibacter mesophilus]|uniref:S8 family serine peptidase n=1 Tax=Brassicibacter mesophilus TaxID=745119 RepID=UPI003D1A2455
MKAKKVMSLLLVLVLVFSTFATVVAAPDRNIRNAHKAQLAGDQKGISISDDPRAAELKDSDKVRIIVELDDAPLIEYATARGLKVNELNQSTASNITNDIISVQTAVRNDIESKSINIKVHNNFINVINGFSATTTLAEARMIEKMPKVQRVVIANEYNRPKPEMNSSKDIIKAVQAWGLGYNGEGMVVSIIDTGIDPDHKDMILTNSEKAELSKDEVNDLKASEELPGEWYTEKVPYGYNYMDNNEEILDLGPDASMHGMHVAGTVGANGDEENGGIKGVAPEVQLLAMKVFGNNPAMPSTFGDVIIRAIDDSVKLGADVINMSLGSTASFVMPNDPEQMAVTRAVQNGVFCAISAGNSNHIGDGYSEPYAKNPDIGVVGAPGLTSESMQVASIENTHLFLNSMKVFIDDEEVNDIAYHNPSPVDPAIYFNGQKQEVVYVGTGEPQYYEGKDVEGKVVLAVRTGSFFYTNIQHEAEKHKVAGVIVRGAEAHGDYVNMALDAPEFPMISLSIPDGNELEKQANSGKKIEVIFTDKKISVPSSTAGDMSDFTSWGVTPNLDFKPEITAPGGQIYSTANDDKYQVMSGTSMAAPHVAGGAALVLQRVKEEWPDLTGIDKIEMAKNLMMSTAKPNMMYDNYSSPRRQGAGVMDLQAALTTSVYITDEDTGLSKVNLQEVDDDIQFTLSVTNFGDETVSYAVYGSVLTNVVLEDYGVNYIFSLASMDILDAETEDSLPVWISADETVFDDVYGVLEVGAGDTVDFDVEIDLSNSAVTLDGEELLDIEEVFPNGTFIEGFIQLIDVNQDTEDRKPALSIPYLGFYGDWDEAPIIDDSVYDENGLPFYGTTGLLDSDILEYLGETPDGLDADKIGFSPNGDGKADKIVPILSFLRNAKELDVNILDSDNNKVRDLAIQENIIKDYLDGGAELGYKIDALWEWDGKINNTIAADGDYYYQIRAKIDYPGAEWQTLEFPVRIDTIGPTVKAEAKYDEEAKTITFEANDGAYPILKYQLIEDEEVIAESSNGIFDVSEMKYKHEVIVRAYDCGWNTVDSQLISFGEGEEPTDPTDPVDPTDPEEYLEPTGPAEGDETIPTVMVEAPEFFATYDISKIEFSGYVDDDSSIDSFKIDGKDVELTFNKFTGNWEFSTELNLKDGMHQIRIEAVDSAKNAIDFLHKIFVDTTKPTIKMTDSIPSSTTSSSVKISADVTDNLPDLKVRVNGNMLANIAPDWSYFSTLPPAKYSIDDYEVSLKMGENKIVIQAEDSVGNEVVKEISITRKKSSSGGGSSSGGSSSSKKDDSLIKATIPTAGGTIEDEEGNIELVFEKGTFDKKAEVEVEVLDDEDVEEPKASHNIKRVADVYEFTSSIDKFNKPVKVKMKYNKSKLDGIDEELLGVYTLNEKTDTWEYVGGKVDKKNRVVEVELNHFSKYTIMASTRTFADIANHWAKHNIEVMAARKIVDGMDGVNYVPQGTMTKAQFVKTLVSLLGLQQEEHTGVFTDIAGRWYTGYVEAALKAGIITATENTFSPDAAITREEMAVMIANTIKYVDETKATTVELTFEDKDQITESAKEAVAIAFNNGIINGRTETTFVPQGTATRAEAATMIYRLLQTLDRI